MKISKKCAESIFDAYDIKSLSEIVESETFNEQATNSIVYGFCVRCGFMEDSIEPDAYNCHCEECETDTVFSIMAIMGII